VSTLLEKMMLTGLLDTGLPQIFNKNTLSAKTMH
jgi:hypothetical protein